MTFTMQIPISCDRRAHMEVMKAWFYIKNFKGFNCQHISRHHNTEADYLERCARMWKFSVEGITYPWFSVACDLEASSSQATAGP